MAILEHKRLRLVQVEDDLAIAKTLQQMPGYAPSNPECSVAEVEALVAAVEAAQTADVLAANQATAARNDVIAVEWALHNRMIAVKNQIRAQYGVDSNEVQMVGLKRASTRKLPRRRNGATYTMKNGNGQDG